MMANQYHCSILFQGVDVWNNWRMQNPDVLNPDLSEVQLLMGRLELGNFRGVNFSRSMLFKVSLNGANLEKANLSHCMLNYADLANSNLTSANLMGADLHGADLRNTNIQAANFSNTDLSHTNFSRGDLGQATFTNANFRGAFLPQCKISRFNFSGYDFYGANLAGADLTDSDFSGADLSVSTMTDAKLTSCNLSNAKLEYATMIRTNIEQCTLTGARIYGTSTWDLEGAPRDQSNLIITRPEHSTITVDDIDVGQFIYLLLNNKKIRNVIETITSKAVLILGRFTPERKKVLDLIRQELHAYNYVPILFDFEKPDSQFLLETVMTLAGLARFIIADVSDATMVREELRSIVEKYPSKPVQPIVNGKEYVTLPEIIQGYKSVLQTFTYNHSDELITGLQENIINPSEAWIKGLKVPANQVNKSEREMLLEQQVETLKEEMQKLKESKPNE
jgi:uncharacterized protein YjbI with pentapeptide repeats